MSKYIVCIVYGRVSKDVYMYDVYVMLFYRYVFMCCKISGPCHVYTWGHKGSWVK